LIQAGDNATKLYANAEAAITTREHCPVDQAFGKKLDGRMGCALSEACAANFALTRFYESIDDYTRCSNIRSRWARLRNKRPRSTLLSLTLFFAHQLEELELRAK